MAKWSWGEWKPEDYEGFNKDLNGVPDKLVARYDPAKYEARKSIAAPLSPTMQKISALGGGITRGGTLGLIDPIAKHIIDPLMKKLRPDYQEVAPMLEEGRKKYPTESAIGELAGTVGSAFVNPVTAGTKGLGILKAAIPGSKLLPTAARNAILTSTAAVPQAVAEAASGEKPGKVAGTLAKNLALGTAVGTAGESLLNKFPAFMKWLKKSTTNTAIREGLEIDPRSLKKAATIGGKIKSASTVRGRVQDIGSDLVDLMNKEGVVDKASREAWIAAQGAKWKAVDEAFDASGKRVSDFAQDIMNHPTIQGVIEDNGPAGQKIIADLIEKADKKKGIAGIREYLQKQSDFAYKPGASKLDSEAGSAAKAIRDVVDAAFVPPQLKADYSKYKAIDEALTRQDLRLPRPFSVGSQTAGRMLGSGIAGGILGGASGVNTQDPDWIRKMLTRSGIGMVAGSLIPRAATALSNKTLGRLSAKIAPMIPELTKVPQIAAEKLGPITAAIGGMKDRQGEEIAELAPGGALESPAQESMKTQEAAIPPENKEAAKEQVNTAWADEIRNRLNGLYDMYLSPYSDEMSREDFIAEIAKVTNNFDPHMTAGAIFPDKQQREAYLGSYDTALKLQGVNMEQALTRAPLGVDPTKNPLLGAVVGANTETQMAADRLKDIVVQHVTETGKPPSQTVIRQISTDIDGIAGLRVSPATKRRVLQEHLANYGIDYGQLARYGLVQGLTT